MNQNLAFKIEKMELLGVQVPVGIVAEVIDLGAAREAKHGKPVVDGSDYEAFMSQYGDGTTSDFA